MRRFWFVVKRFPLERRRWVVGESVAEAGWAALYDGDLEGMFFSTAAVSDRDIALMAAGY